MASLTSSFSYKQSSWCKPKTKRHNDVSTYLNHYARPQLTILVESRHVVHPSSECRCNWKQNRVNRNPNRKIPFSRDENYAIIFVVVHEEFQAKLTNNCWTATSDVRHVDFRTSSRRWNRRKFRSCWSFCKQENRILKAGGECDQCDWTGFRWSLKSENR